MNLQNIDYDLYGISPLLDHTINLCDYFIKRFKPITDVDSTFPWVVLIKTQVKILTIAYIKLVAYTNDTQNISFPTQLYKLTHQVLVNMIMQDANLFVNQFTEIAQA